MQPCMVILTHFLCEGNYLQSMDCSSFNCSPHAIPLSLARTRAPTLYFCTYYVGAGCQMGPGQSGIRVEVLTNQNRGVVYWAPFHPYNIVRTWNAQTSLHADLLTCSTFEYYTCSLLRVAFQLTCLQTTSSSFLLCNVM